MRPAVIELRQGYSHWLIRADYTSERWKYTELCVSVPYETTRRLIMLANPEYIVTWPEQKGFQWQDC